MLKSSYSKWGSPIPSTRPRECLSQTHFVPTTVKTRKSAHSHHYQPRVNIMPVTRSRTRAANASPCRPVPAPSPVEDEVGECIHVHPLESHQGCWVCLRTADPNFNPTCHADWLQPPEVGDSIRVQCNAGCSVCAHGRQESEAPSHANSEVLSLASSPAPSRAPSEAPPPANSEGPSVAPSPAPSLATNEARSHSVPSAAASVSGTESSIPAGEPPVNGK